MFGRKKKPLSAAEKKRQIKLQQQANGRAANRAAQQSMQTAVRNLHR